MERSRFNGRPNDSILELPVFCFLILHSQGCMLFDTGLPAELWSGRSSMELNPGLIATHGSSGGLVREIEGQGYSLEDISIIVNSHTHLDHAGGNNLVARARCYVQDGEDVKGDYDLFGDGSIHLLTTPGHSTNHQSMLVRGRNRQVLLTGDACFRPANLIDLKPPLILENREQALRSLKRLRDISKASATVVLTSHDPLATGEKIVL
ncbi:N-acyl homoserine lactonase family protein [Desulfosporosinus sp. Sb-LF]|nr:N-acyl homoserine lactonase family protein [Desulfosporosinus sp. Sb-LF]